MHFRLVLASDLRLSGLWLRQVVSGAGGADGGGGDGGEGVAAVVDGRLARLEGQAAVALLLLRHRLRHVRALLLLHSSVKERAAVITLGSYGRGCRTAKFCSR